MTTNRLTAYRRQLAIRKLERMALEVEALYDELAPRNRYGDRDYTANLVGYDTARDVDDVKHGVGGLIDHLRITLGQNA